MLCIDGDHGACDDHGDCETRKGVGQPVVTEIHSAEHLGEHAQPGEAQPEHHDPCPGSAGHDEKSREDEEVARAEDMP